MDATPVGLPEHELAARLVDLGVLARVRFAAACAEVLWPTVEAHFRTDESSLTLLRRALDAAWSGAGGGPMSPATSGRRDMTQDIAVSDDAVEELVPDEDDPDFDDTAALAQNGVAAIAYALRTATVDPRASVQMAVWAARQVTDAADLIADRGASLDESTARAAAESCIADFLPMAAHGNTDLRERAVRRAEQMADALDVRRGA